MPVSPGCPHIRSQPCLSAIGREAQADILLPSTRGSLSWKSTPRSGRRSTVSTVFNSETLRPMRDVDLHKSGIKQFEHARDKLAILVGEWIGNGVGQGHHG